MIIIIALRFIISTIIGHSLLFEVLTFIFYSYEGSLYILPINEMVLITNYSAEMTNRISMACLILLPLIIVSSTKI